MSHFLVAGLYFFRLEINLNNVFLSDINLELVTSYNAIKKDPEQVSKLLNSYKANHSKEYYYQVRGNDSNNDPAKITARFIYLTPVRDKDCINI